jgi:glycosyltransferase involved in cell wall biosynthesis
VPKISIAIPVYNGENYLAEAIKSVLDQTLSDFEFVISDNASTDRTSAICRDYAASDPRVRYFRNDTNLGAAPNYNRAFEQCTGAYFKWLAHDDRLLPRYLEVTAAALDAVPQAVLCNAQTEYIGVDGQHLGFYKSVLAAAGSSRPAERFAAMILPSHTCVDFFGLIRRQAMLGSLLHQAFSSADKAFLAQMSLRGRLLQLDEPLVQIREHPNRYTRQTKSARAKRAWHDSTSKGAVHLPTWTLYRTYRRLVATEDLNPRDRVECQQVLRRFWYGSWNSARLAADILSIPFPQAIDAAFKMKYRLFGAPGNFLD